MAARLIAYLTLTWLVAAGCSAASTAVVLEPIARPVLSAAGQVSAARLVDPATRKDIAQLTAEEVARINEVLGRVEESSGYAATTPPWDAAIVLTTQQGGEVIIHFAPPGLRYSRIAPWENGANATNMLWEDNSVDLTLNEDDEEWFWGLLGGYLGSTKVKEYKTLEHDMFNPAGDDSGK